MILSKSKKLQDDKDQILELTRKIFGDVEISKPSFFDWQYLHNPEDEALVMIARDDDNEQNPMIGIESLLPVNIMVEEKLVKVFLSCNSYVHPNYRNKRIFSKLLSLAKKEYVKKDALCIYAVTNDKSFNSFVKQGFHEISNLPILFRPLKLSNYFPFPFNTILHFFDNIWKIKKNVNPNIIQFNDYFDESFEILSKKANQRIPIIKQRTKEFLNWRYKDHPTREYKIFILKENLVLKGYIITRKTNVNGKSIGVIVDFLADSNTNPKKIIDLIHVALDDFWNSDISVTIAISGPTTFEHQSLSNAGFKTTPKFLKPQSNHFVLINSDSSKNYLEKLKKYDNWFFSFGDYDVF